MPSFGQIREAQTLRASALIWPTNLRHASGENRNVTSARFLVSRTSTRLPVRRSTFDGYAGTRSALPQDARMSAIRECHHRRQ